VIILPVKSIAAKESKDDFLIFDLSKHSIWLPATYAVTGTMDVIQNPYWFNQENYTDKVKEVWRRSRVPFHSIKKDGGYKKFFEDEFTSSRVLPNIGLHFLGGAYDTKWMAEYFKHHGYPMPYLFAFITTYASHLGNEALETSSEEISSHDHIADLYLFDLAGFILAQHEPFISYLVDDLGMKAWHFNPMFDLDHKRFFNAGLNYVFRPKKTQMLGGKLKPLYYLGMQTLGGLTYNYSKQDEVTLASGISLTNPLKQKGRWVTMLAHERESELEATLFINGSEDFRWRLNLYEQVLQRFDRFKVKDRSYNFGLIIGQTKGPAYAIGLNVMLPFGIGAIKNAKPIHFPYSN